VYRLRAVIYNIRFSLSFVTIYDKKSKEKVAVGAFYGIQKLVYYYLSWKNYRT